MSVTPPPIPVGPPPRRRSFMRPRSAAGQIALLVVAAILAAHLVTTIAVVALREPWRADNRPGVAASRLATIARMLDTAEPKDRAALLANAARSLPILGIADWDGSTDQLAKPEPLHEHPLIERLRDGFGRALKIVDLSPEDDLSEQGGSLTVGLETPNGARLRAKLPDDPLQPSRQGAILLTFLFLTLSLMLLSLWVTRALTAPLAKLAAAAEAFGTHGEAPTLPRHGAREVVAVAEALDRMRLRVSRMIDDRTQMLAAISHDLRTPITRLRLRAEFIEDEQMRERTLRDLEQMNGLVEAALSYLRDERSGQAASMEAMPLIDLASIAQTVCDGFTDVGADVSLRSARNVLVRGRPDDLQRAITNLVDNAVKYGHRARLAVDVERQAVVLTVSDDGPGLDAQERQAMLQPFVRGDRARNLDASGGYGLGLSIALSIVESHGGRLSLDNRDAGGLDVRIVLPLADAPQMQKRPKLALPAE